ncbi:MAG: outer membrane protein assembly factor BamD [Bryobacteraceae bacterium]
MIALLALLDVSCGFKRKKYDDPITKNTQQPDKVLYDRAINDIEHSRYDVARLTLNTLINTYDSSEYLAKAKLAIADSWYRQGGLTGMAQAEAEYKDFILFYPTMPEAAESQEKICTIHYNEMEKADRDPNNALRAEQECRTLITQFPNSKYVPQTIQKLREIQEVLADAEFTAGDFYHHKGANVAAANRLGALVDQYPLYSRADEALWEEADSYSRLGPRFRTREGEALQKLVRDYPLSQFADQAKKKLESLEIPVPDADPAAVARMKYELANRTKPGMVHRATEFMRRGPEVSDAAKEGTPTMTNPQRSIPVSVPAVTNGQTGVSDVTVAPVTDTTALDTKPDARANPPGAAASSSSSSSSASSTGESSTAAPADPPQSKNKKKKKHKNDKSETANSQSPSQQ